MSSAMLHALGSYQALHMARVVDTVDPDSRGRLQVQLLANNMTVWANVVVPSAGNDYGLACLPRNDEIVVLAFITPEQPMILGSVWSGADSMPSEADPVQENYVVKTPAGTVMAFNDEDGPKMEINTPQGHKICITDGNGGEIEITRGSQSIKLTSTEINLTSSANVTIDAGMITMSASMVQVDAGVTRFSGVAQADTVIASTVAGTTYTPGAGNIW